MGLWATAVSAALVRAELQVGSPVDLEPLMHSQSEM